MDNDKRASAKLAGKKALSVDKPTQLQPEGIEITGSWLQSQPKDFSQPDLRIFSWGFEGDARFVGAGEGFVRESGARSNQRPGVYADGLQECRCRCRGAGREGGSLGTFDNRAYRSPVG